jgi:hypothetical protein
MTGQADEHELACTGGPPAVSPYRRQVQRPGDRLDAHRAPSDDEPVRWSSVPALVSVRVSFTHIHRCSRGAGLASAQVRYRCGRRETPERSPREREQKPHGAQAAPDAGAEARRRPGNFQSPTASSCRRCHMRLYPFRNNVCSSRWPTTRQAPSTPARQRDLAKLAATARAVRRLRHHRGRVGYKLREQTVEHNAGV